MIESIKEGLKNIIPRMEGYKTNLVNICPVQPHHFTKSSKK